MAIDDEVTVGRLLVLADAGLNEWSVLQGRKAEGDIFADVLQRYGVNNSFAVCRIEIRSARVIGDFESAAVTARDAIVKVIAMIAPDGQM